MLSSSVSEDIEPKPMKINREDYRLLAIDDDPDQRFIVSQLLSSEGYNVFTAASGAEALSSMYLRHYDLIITDLRMPDYNGFDLIQELRAIQLIPSSASLPIILLTSCSSDLEFAALELGADMFCEKRLAGKLLPTQVQFLLS